MKAMVLQELSRYEAWMRLKVGLVELFGVLRIQRLKKFLGHFVCGCWVKVQGSLR